MKRVIGVVCAAAVAGLVFGQLRLVAPGEWEWVEPGDREERTSVIRASDPMAAPIDDVYLVVYTMVDVSFVHIPAGPKSAQVTIDAAPSVDDKIFVELSNSSLSIAVSEYEQAVASVRGSELLEQFAIRGAFVGDVPEVGAGSVVDIQFGAKATWLGRLVGLHRQPVVDAFTVLDRFGNHTRSGADGSFSSGVPKGESCDVFIEEFVSSGFDVVSIVGAIPPEALRMLAISS